MRLQAVYYDTSHYLSSTFNYFSPRHVIHLISRVLKSHNSEMYKAGPIAGELHTSITSSNTLKYLKLNLLGGIPAVNIEFEPSAKFKIIQVQDFLAVVLAKLAAPQLCDYIYSIHYVQCFLSVGLCVCVCVCVCAGGRGERGSGGLACVRA